MNKINHAYEIFMTIMIVAMVVSLSGLIGSIQDLNAIKKGNYNYEYDHQLTEVMIDSINHLTDGQFDVVELTGRIIDVLNDVGYELNRQNDLIESNTKAIQDNTAMIAHLSKHHTPYFVQNVTE